MQDLYARADSVLRVIGIFLLAWFASVVINRLISRLHEKITKVMAAHADDAREALEKRSATIGGVLRKTAVVLVWTIAIFMSLTELGYDIGPLIAGAGIAGVAIGFGAQALVRDIISGMFLLMENQVRIGDVAKINGTGGLVEEINLRTTVLRDLEGIVHVFPNGSITTLANLTRVYSCYVFDVGVAYKEDTDKVVEALREVDETLRADPEWQRVILDPLEIFGVDKFADSSVVIKARYRTRPLQQWNVGREMNRRIKKKFDELGIEIPFPHLSLYAGEAAKPFRIEGGSREELKAVVREVLAEQKTG
jgi:small conductance mechanosensitive channel